MLLWTITLPDTHDALLRRGILHGDGRRGWRDFKPAYRWMIEQMQVRGLYDGSPVRSPFWAWVEKPDLRQGGHFPQGTCAVRICFESPDELVLLSDFELWHCVLNDSPLDEDTDETNEQAKVASWQGIFDVRSSDHIQACLPYLRPEWVRGAHEFVAR